MKERLQILMQISEIESDYCKDCVVTNHDGTIIKASNSAATTRCRLCPHLERIQELGEALTKVSSNQNPRKIKKVEGESLAKQPKWQRAGLTLDIWDKLQSEGKTAREIANKFNLDINNDLHAFKKAHGLIQNRANGKNAPIQSFKVPEKTMQNAQQAAEATQTDSSKQHVTESEKSLTAQVDTEKQLTETNLKIVQYKAQITKAAETIQLKDEQLKEAAERIGELESKLGEPAISHDDYELWQKQRAELEKERDYAIREARIVSDKLSDAITKLRDGEKQVETTTIKFAEIVAQNQALQAENEQLRIESAKDMSVHKLLQEKVALQAHNMKLKSELEELLPQCEPENQHPPVDWETSNPYVVMHSYQEILIDSLREQLEEANERAEAFMNENSDLKQELQRIKDLNYRNLQQFIETYGENEVNKRSLRNLEKQKADKGNIA